MTLTVKKTEYPHGICPKEKCRAIVQVYFLHPVCCTHRVKNEGGQPICPGSGLYAIPLEVTK